MSDCTQSFFKDVDPEAPKVKEKYFGFLWQPNEKITEFKEINSKKDPNGLYIGFAGYAALPSHGFFGDPGIKVGIIFKPVTISKEYEQKMTEVTKITKKATLQMLEGYLKYTNDCLNYIYATAAGKTLLDTLVSSGKKTFVFTSRGGNQYIGTGKNLISTAGTIIYDQFNVKENQSALMRALRAAAGEQPNDEACFEWLAAQVNEMPLYSLFVPSEEYIPEFLTKQEHTVTGGGLQQWFQEGNNCKFAQDFNVLDEVEQVNILDFVRLAVIVKLYSHSEKNPGGYATVYFNVKDYAENTAGIPDFNAERPPAVGLAHELVHAYHVVQGEQPGSDFGGYSTTLTELICVGLGPWVENEVSENAVRAEWPPENVPKTDKLNDRDVPPRDPYEPPTGEETAATMRKKFHTI